MIYKQYTYTYDNLPAMMNGHTHKYYISYGVSLSMVVLSVGMGPICSFLESVCVCVCLREDVCVCVCVCVCEG